MRFLAVALYLPTLLSAAMVSGCASDPNAQPSVLEEREFVTGSNIPRRDRDRTKEKVVSREEMERVKDSAGGTVTIRDLKP